MTWAPSLASEGDSPVSKLVHRVAFAASQRLYLSRLSRLDSNAVRVNPKALEYAGLQTMSLSLAGIRSGSGAGHVNLVLPELSPASFFAGLKTALDVAYVVAEDMNLPLRLVVFGVTISSAQRKLVRSMLDARGRPSGAAVEVVAVDAMERTQFSDSDIWIATFWTTAHALDVACKLGIVRPNQVLYLIQDFEPGFLPWSTDYAIASSTYKSGFVPIVNSLPLRDYLSANTDLDAPYLSTFRPQLDLTELRRAAEIRTASGPLKILFYGRPSKPRNMFKLGVAALRVASSTLDAQGIDVHIETIGEAHGSIPLLNKKEMTVLGKMSWEAYFSQLASATVFFSLQASPHPSHPPLDAVASGGHAVVNELGGTRAKLHPRLSAGNADPESLGGELVAAIHAARSRVDTPGFDAAFLASLGSPLLDAVRNASKHLGG